MDQIDFDQALERLQEIVKLVNSDQLALEKSLDLLEEGVEIANLLSKEVNFTSEESRE